jgi:hypothetical protein
VAVARDLYAEDVRWLAPRRSLEWRGRELVLRNLLRECAAMQSAEYTPLRRVSGPDRIVDEYAVRFVYSGEGLEGAPISAGDRVELERLRVLEVIAGRVVLETCIETFTVLAPA